MSISRSSNNENSELYSLFQRASEGHTHSRQDFSSIGSSTAIQAATDRVTSDGMNEPRTVPNSSNFPEK